MIKMIKYNYLNTPNALRSKDLLSFEQEQREQ